MFPVEVHILVLGEALHKATAMYFLITRPHLRKPPADTKRNFTRRLFSGGVSRVADAAAWSGIVMYGPSSKQTVFANACRNEIDNDHQCNCSGVIFN